MYALDLKTGAVKNRFKYAGEPAQSLVCHPQQGPVFVADLGEKIFAIDAAGGKVNRTAGRGMFLAIDSVNPHYSSIVRKGDWLRAEVCTAAVVRRNRLGACPLSGGHTWSPLSAFMNSPGYQTEMDSKRRDLGRRQRPECVNRWLGGGSFAFVL